MRYLFEGALYFKITFLKSLTTLTVNHLNFVKQEGVDYIVPSWIEFHIIFETRDPIGRMQIGPRVYWLFCLHLIK